MGHPGILAATARGFYVPPIARDKGAMDGAPGLLSRYGRALRRSYVPRLRIETWGPGTKQDEGLSKMKSKQDEGLSKRN